MSEFKLTDAQQNFVESFNKNTLVSASAGSGKTSTMIVKLTDMIVNKKIPIKNLLVVTYTNSAGSEMKQKLFNSLLNALQNTDDENEIEFISEQLDEMVNCDIGTLHGICKKIITNYFYVVGQDPTFTLLNEQQSEYVYDSAMDKIFGKLIESNNEQFFYIYSLYNKKRNLNNLKYVVKSIHRYLLSKVDSAEWQDFVVNSSIDKSKEYLINYYKNYFSVFKSDFEKVKLQSETYFPDYNNYIGDRLNFVLAIMGINDYSTLYKFVNDYEFMKKPRKVASKLSADEIDFVIQLDDLTKKFADAVKHFKSNFVLMNEEECEQYINLLKSLLMLVNAIKCEYDSIKKSQNVLDFSDLEHVTLKILENQDAVSALKEKYKYIFVDEYQDINQVQETIISRIKRDDNLYMIGDVKQSIYAFRLSSPEIFINKFNRFMIETELNKVINLNENFRSKENILEFSNFIFNKLITDKTIGINYKKNSQLVAGIKEDLEKCVELNIIDDQSDLTEAQVIVNKIGDYIKQGYNFKDIAILLRSKGDLVNEIVDELKKYNIPCEATYKTDLFKNNEVLVIYYLLKLANNASDDIGVATVLKSMFVGLTDNELAEIRLVSDDLNFNECVHEYMLNGTNDHIKQKIVFLYDLIKKIRFDLNNKPIIEVLQDVLNKYNVFNYYLSFVDGLEKISNINEFLRIVSNDEYKYDLQKCINYLSNVKKNGVVTLMLSGAVDSVKIMTIHSSKGLEYPVVIIGGVGKKFVLNKQTEDVIINDKLGIGVRLFNLLNHTQKDSIVKNACKIINKKNEIDEEIRLLYVALTRAKKRLCIVGEYSLDDVKVVASKDVYSSRSYLDLIFKSFPTEIMHNFENKVGSFEVNTNKKSVFDVNILNSLTTEDIVDNRGLIFNSNDEKVIKEMAKYYDYVYPYQSSKNIAIKNSVSQILKEEVDYENQIDSIVSGDKLDDSALKLGTAYHSVMQNVNYSENKAEIKEIIDRIKTPDLPYGQLDVTKIEDAIISVKKLMTSDSKVMKEAQFVMKVNYGKLFELDEDVDVLIQGVVDLAIINNDEAIIIDFKTNKTHNENSLVNRYGLQLKMYSEAFEKAYNLKVKKRLLYSFEMNKFIEV